MKKYTNTQASFRDGDESGCYWVPEAPMPAIFEAEMANEALSIESLIDLDNGDYDVQVTRHFSDGQGDVHTVLEDVRPIVLCRDTAMATALTHALNTAPGLIEAAPKLLAALIDLLGDARNDEELARILELIENNQWPNRWTGEEITGDTLLQIMPTKGGGLQHTMAAALEMF